MTKSSETNTSSQDLAKAYEFSAVERKWYEFWENEEKFRARNG